MNLHSHSIISLVCLCRSFLITVSGCQGSLRCAFINSGLRRAGINYRRNATHFTQKTPSSQILHNSGLRGVFRVGFEGWLDEARGGELGAYASLRTISQAASKSLSRCVSVGASAYTRTRASVLDGRIKTHESSANCKRNPSA